MSAAVLIPARNEAQRLPSVLQQVHKHLPRARVLVVDGESVDDTAGVARRAGAEVITQQWPGYCGALRSGYVHLLSQGITRLVQLDADGQHPPSAVPTLLRELDGCDWVIGSRAGTRSPGSFSRRAGNAVLSCAVWMGSGVFVGDVTSGLWALGPRAVKVFAEKMHGQTADANIRMMAIKQGLTIHEVPVTMTKREGGLSMHGGWRGVRNFQRSLHAVWREACV